MIITLSINCHANTLEEDFIKGCQTNDTSLVKPYLLFKFDTSNVNYNNSQIGLNIAINSLNYNVIELLLKNNIKPNKLIYINKNNKKLIKLLKKYNVKYYIYDNHKQEKVTKNINKFNNNDYKYNKENHTGNDDACTKCCSSPFTIVLFVIFVLIIKNSINKS